jgi:zinc transport system permease protein
MTVWLERWVHQAATFIGTEDFVILGTSALILISLICGSVGALVVGNRMAFFSDALAHCSFAGIALGILTAILTGSGEDRIEWLLPLVMIGSGVLFGIAIAFVKEKTSLTSDTVIGVFFAGAIGLGAILFGALRFFTNKTAEHYLFGSVNFVTETDLLWLMLLALLTLVVLMTKYNDMVFASFNASLARSRRIPIRFQNYLFIVLLALIVNISIQAVGILLVNAMIIVPAATAINLSRNLRQMVWWTIGLSLGTGLSGIWLSFEAGIPIGSQIYRPGPSGYIVVLNVISFIGSMAITFWTRRVPT